MNAQVIINTLPCRDDIQRKMVNVKIKPDEFMKMRINIQIERTRKGIGIGTASDNTLVVFRDAIDWVDCDDIGMAVSHWRSSLNATKHQIDMIEKLYPSMVDTLTDAKGVKAAYELLLQFASEIY